MLETGHLIQKNVGACSPLSFSGAKGCNLHRGGGQGPSNRQSLHFGNKVYVKLFGCRRFVCTLPVEILFSEPSHFQGSGSRSGSGSGVVTTGVDLLVGAFFFAAGGGGGSGGGGGGGGSKSFTTLASASSFMYKEGV